MSGNLLPFSMVRLTRSISPYAVCVMCGVYPSSSRHMTPNQLQQRTGRKKGKKQCAPFRLGSAHYFETMNVCLSRCKFYVCAIVVRTTCLPCACVCRIWIPSIDRFAIKIIEAPLQPNRPNSSRTHRMYSEVNGKSNEIPISLCK